MDTPRICTYNDVGVGDFIEVFDYDLYGQVSRIIVLDPDRVGKADEQWYTFHVIPHDLEFPHDVAEDGNRVVVGPKRSTDRVVNWS